MRFQAISNPIRSIRSPELLVHYGALKILHVHRLMALTVPFTLRAFLKLLCWGRAQAVGCSLVALSDYTAVGASEVSLREGQQAELLKVGCAGWWYVRLAGTCLQLAVMSTELHY